MVHSPPACLASPHLVLETSQRRPQVEHPRLDLETWSLLEEAWARKDISLRLGLPKAARQLLEGSVKAPDENQTPEHKALDETGYLSTSAEEIYCGEEAG